MNGIDMVNSDVSMSQSASKEIQSGSGGSGIEMANMDLTMSHTPVSCVQTGGSSSGIEMIAGEGVTLSRSAAPGSPNWPSDKGDV